MIATTIIKEFYTFTAGSAPTSFVFKFHFGYTSEIKAKLTRPDGTSITLTEDVDYTVSSPASSGTLTRISTWDSQATQLTIYRVTAQTNEQSIPDGTAIDGPTLEATIDEVVQMAQELDDIGTRALRVPITDTAEPGDIPTKDTRAGHFLAFDSNGDPVAADPSSVPVSTFMQPVVDSADLAGAVTELGGAGAVRAAIDAAPGNPAAPTAWSPTSSSTYNVSTTPPRYLDVDPSTYTATVQLPAVSGNIGRRLRIQNVGTSTGTIVVAPASGEALAGITDGTWTITEVGGWLEIECDGAKWNVVSQAGSILRNVQTSQTSQTSAAGATWYNLGGSLTVPPGTYRVRYRANGQLTDTSTNSLLQIFMTLSTTNNGETDNDLSTASGTNTNSSYMYSINETLAVEKVVRLSTSTTYYLNIKGDVAGELYVNGGTSYGNAIIEAERVA